jgi:hypothetical protein
MKDGTVKESSRSITAQEYTELRMPEWKTMSTDVKTLDFARGCISIQN